MLKNRSPQWSPRAVVFDCDGTLLDSEKHWVDARCRVLADHGVVPDEKFTDLAQGVHYTECGRLMATMAGRPGAAAELTDALLGAFRTLAAAAPVTCPGAPELVASMAGRLPLAVASNCPQDVVETCLAGAGLLHHFRHVVVPGGPVRPKPEPDVYAEAAARCAIDPAECLAFEDSLCGIRSAVSAGIPVVGIGRNPSHESLQLADGWVSSLEDPELISWAGGWSGASR
ncbi:HAD family hydrolase [Streptomyces qinzhouensis]|uniref:HAD family phosphatase n=1 Tax=Streptomyces qinzhouensis TaxID=2599401 RepID=A0A5B8INH9_9ACTN|nr:HAD family phosphatase [Streptomyces qinzhouensis]QDY80228.1 HAD family phosphatase [Streptomyces qinzhouensis]